MHLLPLTRRARKVSSGVSRGLLACGLVTVLLATPLHADDKETSLMTDGAANFGWTFDNGQEFAGATGSLEVDKEHQRQDHDTLKLTGDFSNGGAYVSAGTKVPDIVVDKLTIWVRCPMINEVTLRLIDGSDQCHQLKVRFNGGNSWDRIVLPLADYFKGKEPGKRQSVTIVNGYQSWGGAADGKWHGACKGVFILLGPPQGEKLASMTLNFADVSVTTKDASPASP